MGRYKGPVCKLCRREGEKLYLKGDRCDTPKCSVTKRKYPPGRSGVSRRKLSEFGIRLREKQKAKRYYRLSEEQFRNTYNKAVLKKGVKGDNFLKTLELRLDNVVARLGLAASRAEARQLIRHRHFKVNGVRVDIPSYILKPDDKISIYEKSNDIFDVKVEMIGKKKLPAWLSFDVDKRTGAVLREPDREEIDVPVNELLIVEFYSR